MKKMQVSIVIPVFNEAENVGLLHAEIVAAVRTGRGLRNHLRRRRQHRRIHAELKKIRAGDARVKIIHFRKNFGRAPPFRRLRILPRRCGRGHGRRPAERPRDIPQLVDKVAEGYDIVTAGAGTAMTSG